MCSLYTPAETLSEEKAWREGGEVIIPDVVFIIKKNEMSQYSIV